jgi:SAM-dependent methyltransferase
LGVEREYLETNRRHWDELVPLHMQTRFYNVDAFKAGASSLHELELAEVGDVAGKSLLHLQCHFGLDTLSWARRGAEVTGVDFSPVAIAAAQSLAAECGIEARFVESDLYSLPERLEGRFDIVYTSYGVVFWHPDVRRWAQLVARYVKLGGFFYIAEFHPFCSVFHNEDADSGLEVRYPYFEGEALRFEEDGTYADREAKLENRVTYSWPFTIGGVVTSLIDAGLRVEFLHEHPFTVEQFWPLMEEVAQRKWALRRYGESIPLTFSLKATRAE